MFSGSQLLVSTAPVHQSLPYIVTTYGFTIHTLGFTSTMRSSPSLYQHTSPFTIEPSLILVDDSITMYIVIAVIGGCVLLILILAVIALLVITVLKYPETLILMEKYIPREKVNN